MEHKDVHRAQKWMGWGAGNSNSEILFKVLMFTKTKLF